MQYEILEGSLPYVIAKLNKGESVYTETKSVKWMSENIMSYDDLEGDFLSGIKTMVLGDMMEKWEFTSYDDGEQICFESSIPGKIIPVEINTETNIIVQKNALLFLQSNVDSSMYLFKRLGKGYFSKEGIMMNKLSGKGLAFINVRDNLEEIELSSGQELKVDISKVTMFEENLNIDIEVMNDFTIMATFTGTGKIYLQTKSFENVSNQ
ncbi:hypothetical protein CLPU_18c00530 [Gottschalkia purinilytica]|uniref:AIM24 family protein n=1 Tax=Gottschalkia purinilytica TaxID=1503 RepID=A0A0L0W7B7_GOTPU|nr:AIM24 family protein [Gottschalkia purinilytica]KNF07371.1 hypothetical protein CLPU_18c00530 [Gottschalkia purinilytica]